MSEVSSDPYFLAQWQAAGQIHSYTQSVLRRLYGPHGTHPKKFHTPEHSGQVQHDVVHKLGKKAEAAGRIPGSDLPLLAIVASGHDWEQRFGPGRNEAVSAENIQGLMRDYDCFGSEHIERVGKLTLASIVTDYAVLAQNIDPDDYASMLFADADVANLGESWEVFQANTLALFQELYPGEPMNGPVFEDFLVKEQHIMDNKRFYTAEAREAFPNIPDNASRVPELALVASR